MKVDLRPNTCVVSTRKRYAKQINKQVVTVLIASSPTDQTHAYIVNNIIQVKYIVEKAFRNPLCANILILEVLVIMINGHILDEIVQKSQFLPHARPQHILVAILGRDYNSAETTWNNWRQ